MTIFNMAYIKSNWWWGWWQPWENTILYCPLTEDTDNKASTSFTTTLVWTATPQTIWYYFDGSSYLKIMLNWSETTESQFVWWTFPFTISIWAKSVSGVSSTSNYSPVYMTEVYVGHPIAWSSYIIYGTGSRYEMFNWSSPSITPTISDSTQWHLYTIVFYQNQQLIYQDTTLVWLSNNNYILGTSTQNTWYVSFPARNYDYWRNKWAYLWTIIVEKGWWDLQAITDYYDQTKSNYWL